MGPARPAAGGRGEGRGAGHGGVREADRVGGGGRDPPVALGGGVQAVLVPEAAGGGDGVLGELEDELAAAGAASPRGPSGLACRPSSFQRRRSEEPACLSSSPMNPPRRAAISRIAW